MADMIRMFKPFIPATVDGPLLETLHSGYITQGPKVEQFEGLLREYFDNPYVVTLNSGTSAIQLALRLAGVKAGTEVISTPMTCIATNVAIMATGAKIVWADVNRWTGLMDPLDAYSKITPKTRAIVTVDWGGSPVNYYALKDMCQAAGIKHISDAAHSLGSEYEQSKVGTEGLADYTCFSFQAIKTMTTVDGGLLVLSNDEDYDRAKKLRWFGIPRDNDIAFRAALDVEEWGYKFHMNDVNATIGIDQMQYLDQNLARQYGYGKSYWAGLNAYRYAPTFPIYRHWNATWLYTVKVMQGDRDAFVRYMATNDIEVSQVHWRNDKLSVFKKFRAKLPNLDHYADRMVCIPVHHQLTQEEIGKVMNVMEAWDGA